MLEILFGIICITPLFLGLFIYIGLFIDVFANDKQKKKDEIIEIWFEEIKDDDNVGKGRHNSRNPDRRNKR